MTKQDDRAQVESYQKQIEIMRRQAEASANEVTELKLKIKELESSNE